MIIIKLILDDFINEELKDYLLMQEGITDVIIKDRNIMTELNVKFNKKTTPKIIMKYIELFQNKKYPILFEFDKEEKGESKVLKYTIDDMCCEYCYKGLVMDLFENEKIKSIKSNFEFNKPAFNIEFIIEYDKNYNDEDIIKYINEKK